MIQDTTEEDTFRRNQNLREQNSDSNNKNDKKNAKKNKKKEEINCLKHFKKHHTFEGSVKRSDSQIKFYGDIQNIVYP